jgi:hypothetical protein
VTDTPDTAEQRSIDALTWRKSLSCPNSATCVEVAELPDGGYGMRDGKDPDGPVLTFSRPEWAGFLSTVLAGGYQPAK